MAQQNVSPSIIGCLLTISSSLFLYSMHNQPLVPMCSADILDSTNHGLKYMGFFFKCYLIVDVYYVVRLMIVAGCICTEHVQTIFLAIP